MFSAFWLGNMLRATVAHTFSTSIPPKVVRAPHFFNILTWRRASRHNGVQFFIYHLARWLRTCRFSEPTFRPSRPTYQWKSKAQCFVSFVTFRAPVSSFFCLFLSLSLSPPLSLSSTLPSSLTLPISAFHLSKLPLIMMEILKVEVPFGPQQTVSTWVLSECCWMLEPNLNRWAMARFLMEDVEICAV